MSSASGNGKKKIKMYKPPADDRRTVALLHRKYTTRQIMELMEFRRRQQGITPEAEERAVVEPDTEAVSGGAVHFQSLAAREELMQRAQEAAREPKEHAPFVARFELEPKAPEQSGEPLPFVEHVPVSKQEPEPSPETKAVFETTDPGLSRRSTVEAYEEPWYAKPLAHATAFFDYLGHAVVDGVVTAGGFILFVLMLANIFSEGSSPDYPQGPFLVLIGVLTIWFNRTRLHKGEKGFGLGMVSLIAGLAMFSYGTLSGLISLEMGGFVLTALGLFCARYTRTAAALLVLPLFLLMLAVAPDSGMESAFASQLNIVVAEASAVVLNFLNIPVSWNGLLLTAGGYEFNILNDLGVFRSIAAALPLAVIYAHLHSKRHKRKRVVFFSIVPLVLLASLIHWVTTGWVAYTYGQSYADAVYQWAGWILYGVLGLFAFVDSLFSEEDHF